MAEYARPSSTARPREIGVPPVSLDIRSRARGCLLGGAIGDALGAPVEFASLGHIRARHGARGVTDLLPSSFGAPGLISDDTQMTLFTVEALLDDAADLGKALYAAYQRWLVTQERST